MVRAQTANKNEKQLSPYINYAPALPSCLCVTGIEG